MLLNARKLFGNCIIKGKIMLYINQREYPETPFPNNLEGGCPPEKQNIAKAGCGICSACMVVDHLTAKSLTLEECVQMAMDAKLGPALAEKFGLKFSYTSKKEEMLAHLRKGGRVIVNVANRPDGTAGLFTKGGHYMVLISADGERICFLDPNYHESYDEGGLKEKVDSTKAPFLYCDADLMEYETENREIKYYLFERA